jgi:peptidoglycan hydrolase-like protein with peptidoglycan-binding domain
VTTFVDADTAHTADTSGERWTDELSERPAGQASGGPSGDRRRVGLAVALVAVLGIAGIAAVVTDDSDASLRSIDPATVQDEAAVDPAAVDPAAVPAADAAAAVPADAAAADPAAAILPDLEGNLGQNTAEAAVVVDAPPERADGGCTIGALSVRLGSNGPGVVCLQEKLIDLGYYDGAAGGDFDDATLRAAMQYQEAEGLFVDGVIGRESAISLGIWPDEESFVVRTPPPPDGAMDSTGYLLSPVASTGSDAPPLPPDSGSGRRVVYDRAGQRVWAVGKDGEIIRSWLVSGSKFSNEAPGVHEVYSKSERSTAWNGKAWLPLMIRYQVTDIGHIGFHAIPLHVSDNTAYQTTDELGQRLSGGCQRQHNLDAAFLWAWADIGTTVVVT